MKSKKIFFLAASLVLAAFLLAGCGGSGGGSGTAGKGAESGKKFVMRLGTASAGEHRQNKTMEEFKKRLEAKAGDRITVENYPASQLGTAAQMIQGLQDGSVQGVLLPSGYYGSVVPQISVIDLPFFFENSDQAYRILNSGGDAALKKYLEAKGIVPVAWLRGSDRLILSKKPLNSMNDLKGMKLWCFPNPIAQEEVKAFGASPTNLDPGDLAVGLQQGTVDGAVTDATFFNAMKLYVTAPYLLMAPRGSITNAFMVSKVWLDSLPEDLQKAVRDTAKEVVEDFEYNYLKEYEKKSMDNMKANGLKVIEPSEAFLADMKAASQAVHQKYLQSVPQAQEVYDGLKALIEKDSQSKKQ
ncbi:MAG: TRAP transporter substrate-binding protein [Desulfotomaculales bacterium]